MKKLILILCFALALTACKDEKKAPETQVKPVIKIGAIIPLSGPQAAMGEAAKAGMQKALKEKTNSDQHYSYELVFGDNQAKLQVMPTLANKIILQDNVDALATITSAMARVIAPITDEKEKVLYNFSIEQGDYQRFGKYTFTQGMPIDAIADKAEEFLTQKGMNDILIFAENIGIIGSLTTYLSKNLSEKNIRHNVNTFNPGERDFRVAIEKAKAEGYKYFFTFGFPPERTIIRKQLVESSVTNDYIYSFCMDLEKASDDNNNITTVTYNPGPSEFVESVQQEYNIDSTFGSAVFYDFVSLMIEAYEALYKNGEKPTAEEITTYIHGKKKYPCMSGICIVNENGFITNDPVFRTFQNGKWQTIGE